MDVPRVQADGAPPLTAPPPLRLTTAAVEELNARAAARPPSDSFDRWLCEILLGHSSSDTDLLLFASVPSCREVQSIASSSIDPLSPAPQTEPSVCLGPVRSATQSEEPATPDADSSRFRSIVRSHESCVRTLQQMDQREAPPFLHDIVGRFRVWTANSGARRWDKMSLDHRLRESIELKEMVINLLEDLSMTLQQGELRVLCM